MSNSEDRNTSIGGSSGNSRRETRVAESTSFEEEARRIVGVIVTYTWKQAGELFEIRLGKNYIGREKVGRMPGDPYCDIQVDDPKMSSSHALILCRELSNGGEVKFDLIDQESSNGTYLNDTLIDLTGETLTDDCVKIRTGSTVWTFMKIISDPKESSGGDETLI